MPDWLNATLTATPAVAWIFFGLGLPWSLTALPRKDWRDRALVVYVALAFGPALLSVWMFALGTLGNLGDGEGALLRFDLVFTGTLIMAGVGALLAWRKWRYDATGTARVRVPLALDEKLIIGLMAAATAIRWAVIAFWPFTAYDALWVYGYEGRLYTLLGRIPDTIDYYPQFMPLQYSYAQLAAGGIDDHAARAVLPFLNVGSILGVYVLGARLFGRRAGIIAAALWAFYPHFAEWSRFGDLEVTLAFLFAGATTFFLMAWSGEEPRYRYAVIGGLLFSIGLWTKPTMGAFAIGVALLVALELVRVRFDWRAWRPRFMVALAAGAASAPLGGVWYLRNVLLGHEAIVFPAAFWRTLAERSGEQFAWPLLALLVALAYLYAGRRERPTPPGLLGLGLVLAGLLPSIINPHRINGPEWLAFAAGAGLIGYTLLGYSREHLTANGRAQLRRGGWLAVLALPYFVTWFHSFSYHYRLAFAIVPLMLMPTAVILANWLGRDVLAGGRWSLRTAALGAIILLTLPGIALPLRDPNAGWDWLWSGELRDDNSKYASGNGALMDVVNGIQIYIDEAGAAPIVSAPSVERLPFFFPLADIRVDETPTNYAEVQDVTYFVYGVPETRGAYGDIPLLQNQFVSALSRSVYRLDDPNDIIRTAWWEDDGTFNYTVYELHLDNRFAEPQPINQPDDEIVFGDFLRFVGHDAGGAEFWPGRQVGYKLMWEVLAPPPDDYMIYIHLRDTRDGGQTVWAAWDGPVTNAEDGSYYSSLVWEPGEYIIDDRVLALQDAQTPEGAHYEIIIGLYSLASGERVPLTINGEPAGDGYRLNEPLLQVASAPPG